MKSFLKLDVQFRGGGGNLNIWTYERLLPCSQFMENIDAFGETEVYLNSSKGLSAFNIHYCNYPGNSLDVGVIRGKSQNPGY
jgi:hypothetical protein